MLHRPTTALSSAIAALALIGCAAQPSRSTDATLYQRLGGQAAITAVVDDALANVAVDPRINQRFRTSDTMRLKNGLVELLCDRTGGPCTYRGRNMSDAHEGMMIRDDEFDALVDDLVRALDKHRVPAREKNELLALLGRMKNAIIDH
jgi:hemoglobin